MQSVFEIFDSEAPSGYNSQTLNRLMGKCNRIQHEPSGSVCENYKYNPCLHGQVLTKDGFVTKAKIRLVEPHWAINQEECREIIRVIDNADNYESDKVEYENKVD